MNLKNTAILAICTLLISACGTSKTNSSKPAETPQVLLSKANDRDKKQYVQNKMNDLNVWWQQFKDPLLMLLIKRSQESHSDISSARLSLNKYFKQYSENPLYQTQWEKDNLQKINTLTTKSSYWYDLRTSLSAEVARQFMIYSLNMSQLNLLNDYSSLDKNNINSEKIESLKNNIQLSIKSLEILTKIPNKELQKLLNNNFISIGEKIITNSFPIVIPESIDAVNLSQRADVYLNILKLQQSLFNSTKNKAFPIISLEGKITAQRNEEPIQIRTKFKDSKEKIEVEYSEIDTDYKKLQNNLDEVSMEISHQLKILKEVDENLNITTEKNKALLEKIQLLRLNNQDYKEMSIQFIENSLKMISLEEQRILHWINLYKSVGGGF